MSTHVLSYTQRRARTHTHFDIGTGTSTSSLGWGGGFIPFVACFSPAGGGLENCPGGFPFFVSHVSPNAMKDMMKIQKKMIPSCRCSMLCYAMLWCVVVSKGVKWCHVLKALLPEGNGRDVYPRAQVNGRAMCVVCALCACVLLHSRTSAHSHLAGSALPTPVPSHTGSRRPTAPCMRRCTISACCVVPHCLLLCTTLHCTVCAPLHCNWGQRAVGSGYPATHCHTTWRLWAVELLQRIASLPRGSGQWGSRFFCNALLLCLGAVGSATPAMHWHYLGTVGSATRAMHCLTTWGQWAVELLQYIASLPRGSGQWDS